MRLRARDHYTLSTLIGGCKVYMDSYMASNGSCFMVAWTKFQKPLFGGRSDTKLGDHGTDGLFYFIMCEDPHE